MRRQSRLLLLMDCRGFQKVCFWLEFGPGPWRRAGQAAVADYSLLRTDSFVGEGTKMWKLELKFTKQDPCVGAWRIHVPNGSFHWSAGFVGELQEARHWYKIITTEVRVLSSKFGGMGMTRDAMKHVCMCHVSKWGVFEQQMHHVSFGGRQRRLVWSCCFCLLSNLLFLWRVEKVEGKGAHRSWVDDQQPRQERMAAISGEVAETVPCHRQTTWKGSCQRGTGF